MLKVFMPTFNPDENSIKMTLDSVFGSKVSTPPTVYVVDNGSTSDIRRMLAEYPVNIMVNKSNMGRIQNWNRCLDIFRMHSNEDDAMKFIFCGDWLEPDCLRDQESIILFGTDVVSCAHRVHSESGETYVMNHSPDSDMFLSGVDAVRLCIEKGNWMAGCAACPMFTKRALGNMRFDENLQWASDWKFWVDIAMGSDKVCYISRPLTNFNMRFRNGFLNLQGRAGEEEIVMAHIKKLINPE